MARGMEERRVAHWKAVLAHAGKEWARQGIRTRSMADDSVEAERTAIWRYLRAYRGDQWDELSWGGIPREDLVVTPLFFSAANTFQAQLIARAPKIEVFPRRSQESAADARLFSALLNYDVWELKLKRQWNRAVKDAFFMPFGVVRVGFTPPEEFSTFDGRTDRERLIETYDPARPAKPYLRRWPLWDFRLDPLAETPDNDGDARWCAFRSLLTMDEIRRNPNMREPEDLEPTVSKEVVGDLREKVRPVDLFMPSGEKFDSRRRLEFVEVWTVYDKTERVWFQMTPGSRKALRDPDDWPDSLQAIDGLPYSAVYFNEQSDSLFPEPYAHTIWNTIQERNKARTLMHELVKRMRRVMLYRRDAVPIEERHKLEDLDLTEWIGMDADLDEAIKDVPLGGFDQTLLLFDQMLKEDVREAIGQSRFTRGQRENVESGTEAARIALGDEVNAGRNLERVEDFLNSSVRQYAQARQATADVEETVNVLGVGDTRILQDAPTPFFRITPDRIRQEFDFHIQAGSTLPRTRDQDVRAALADIEVMSQQPEIHNLQQGFIDYWVARQKDPTKYMLNAQELRATQQARPALPDENAGESGQLANLLSALPAEGGVQ